MKIANGFSTIVCSEVTHSWEESDWWMFMYATEVEGVAIRKKVLQRRKEDEQRHDYVLTGEFGRCNILTVL